MAAHIHLCSGLYQPFGSNGDIPAVEVIGQTITLDGVSYVWIDGVDTKVPILLPVHVLHNYKRIGTLQEYLEDERHESLEQGFEWLLHLCATESQSATTMVRACEMMHKEGLPADEAIKIAHIWAELLCEMSKTEQQIYRQLMSTH